MGEIVSLHPPRILRRGPAPAPATAAQFNSLCELIGLALLDWEREHGRGLTDKNKAGAIALAAGAIARDLARAAPLSERDTGELVDRFLEGFYHPVPGDAS